MVLYCMVLYFVWYYIVRCYILYGAIFSMVLYILYGAIMGKCPGVLLEGGLISNGNLVNTDILDSLDLMQICYFNIGVCNPSSL